MYKTDIGAAETVPEKITVTAGKAVIGGGRLCVIAGPCAVESEEQILAAAKAVSESGADILRGGAYKPRTSPYDFQGLEGRGLRLLREAADAFGLAAVSEVMSEREIDEAVKYCDMIQIGTRSMQNFCLLRAAGQSGMPVLLKRGMSATVTEWLDAAEYIISEGNSRIVLCERGIRTFETATRNTLDVSAVAAVRQRSSLPVVIDPSHAAGHAALVTPLALAGIAAGADGLMIEVHPQPENALSDAAQQLTPAQFASLMRTAAPVAAAVGRSI